MAQQASLFRIWAMTYWDFPRSPVSVRLMLNYAQARGVPAMKLLRGSRLT